MSSKKGRKRGISRSTDVQTAWSTYLRGLQSYFTTWRQKSWFCLTANFKMNLQRVCTALQISLGDILYLCHTPSRERDADGCSLYWEDVLMVITSLVFFLPFSILSTILSFNCLRLSYSSGRRQPSAMNHTMLWIKCNNTDLQPCKHRHTQMMAADESQSLAETKTSLRAKHVWLVWKCTHPRESYEAYTQDKEACK